MKHIIALLSFGVYVLFIGAIVGGTVTLTILLYRLYSGTCIG